MKHLGNQKPHVELIEPVRELLQATGKPYVIENVPGAPLLGPVILCGTMFGLKTECGAQLRRHRLFETNWPLWVEIECRHNEDQARTIGIYGHSPDVITPRRTISVHGDHARDGAACSQRKTITVTGSTPQQNVVRNKIRECFPVSAAREAMGIDWMIMAELSQAIPPAYTHFIGEQLLQVV